MGVSLAALRVGVLRATLSLRCCAALRTANAPSACLTQYAFGHFTLFDAHYQVFTRLKFFTLFELLLFYLVYH
ncbi:MAG: hypothetical protein RML94_14475 [Bacteroidia bacterium]|nr:hypothetical protein [Bacteroidia bacterium]